MTASLDQIFLTLVDTLAAAVTDRSHGWRTPTLATIDRKATPSQRMVVMRSFDRTRYALTCVTDRRSAKVDEIITNPDVSLHYWDNASSTQLRVNARATPVDDANRLEDAWERLPESTRTLFVDRKNFVLLNFEATRFELLELATSPHRRSAFELRDKGYSAHWLTP